MLGHNGYTKVSATQAAGNSPRRSFFLRRHLFTSLNFKNSNLTGVMVSFEEATREYRSWIEENGVQFLKNCDILDLRSKNEGRGVIAKEDIAEGDIIFQIPRSVTLNIYTSSLVTDFPETKDTLVTLNQWEALIIILLYELKVKKDDSKWRKYFQVLPLLDKENYQFNQLMFWTEDEIEALVPSLITQRIGKELADGMYRKLFPTVVIDKLELQELKDTSLIEYHQIASLIMSYSFDIEKLNADGVVDGEDEEDEEEEEADEKEDHVANGKPKETAYGAATLVATSPMSDEEHPDSITKDPFLKALIPLADTLNADSKRHNASLEYDGSLLVIRAIKNIKAGEQIYNTYSDHPNSEILRRYGYVEISGSKHDFGELPLKNIKQFFVNCSTPLNKEFFEEILTDFQRIVLEESDDEVVDFVLDSYDCFVTSEIIIELIIILQCLTIVAEIHAVNPMTDLSLESRFQLIRRIYRKCIQLIQSGKLTENLLSNYKLIMQSRLDEYPKLASSEFSKDCINNRKTMARVVLQSEYKSLNNCLNIDKTFKINDTKFAFVEDEKLIRNIIKRKFDAPVSQIGKKSKTQ